jgi:hypothetical protein
MLSGGSPCIYCGKTIDPDGKGDRGPSLEHVIGWSLGGSLTIPTHRGCNARANRIIDLPLAKQPDLGRLRGTFGIPTRSGRYVHREVWDSPRGLRAFIFWTCDGLRTRLIPVEIAAGNNETEVFIEPDDSESYDRTQRERAEREGCYLADAEEPAGPSLVGKELAILFREPAWTLPHYLWPAAAAKFALGVIADSCRHGFLEGSMLNLPLVVGLRTMAFEKAIITELWDPERLHLLPTTLDSTSCLAALFGHEHLLAIRAGQEGQCAVLQIVIFGRIAYELDLVGLRVPQDRAWLFDGVRRKVRRLGWAELETALGSRASQRTEQLHLDALLLAPAKHTQVPSFEPT